MADTLKDFLVSIGFSVDEAARKRAEAAVQQSEAKLTDATVTESARRQRAEDKALADRVNAITSVGGELDAEEKAAAARFIKTQADRADKDRKIQEEAAKKTRERRESAFKEAQKFALQFAAFATKAALAIEATALGIVYATDKAAKGFEQLNYAAQRIGSAPRSISAFAYAASQMGSSVEEANGSLEKFGDNLRLLPGFEGNIKALGVRTREANGHLRDSADIATDLGTALAKIRDSDPTYGYTNAIARAKNAGIGENLARALMRPGEFKGREAQYNADQAKIGADPDAAAKGGTAFEQSMRHLEEVSSAVATKIETNLFKKIQPLLDKLGDWIAANGEDIATVMSDIADKLVRFATAMGDAFAKVDWDAVLKKVDKFFTEFDRLARQYFGKDGVTAVFEAFGVVLALNVLGKLTAIVGALRTLGGMSLPMWLLRMLGVAGVGTAAIAGGAFLGSTTGLNAGEPTVNPDGSLTYPDGHTASGRVWNGGQEKASLWDRFKGKLGIGDKGSPLPKGAGLDNAKESYAFWREKGLSHYAAMGMVAQEGGESNFNPHGPAGDNGTAIGSFQWHADRRAKILAGTGIDVTDPKTTHRQMLEAAYWELSKGGEQASLKRLQASKSTDEAVAAGVEFERPGNAMGAIRTRIGIARGLEGTITGGTGNRTPSSEAPPLHSLSKPQTSPEQANDPPPPGISSWGTDSKGNPVPIDKNGRSIPWHRGMPADGERQHHVFPKDKNGDPIGGIPHSYGEVEDYAAELMKKYRKPPEQPAMPTLKAPLGITPSVTSSILNNNSKTRGDTTITHNPTYNIQGGDPLNALHAARLSASRGQQDLLRNIQGAEQ